MSGMTRALAGLPLKIGWPSLGTALQKKRAVGLVLFLVILSLFFAFNRFPKLDIVGGDLDVVTATEVQCFQGFCIEREPGSNFLTRWWVFSVTYLRLVTVGMMFAFLVAGLTESFLFPDSSGTRYISGGTFKRTLKGLAVGPVMNLCSACIVPVSRAYERRGGGIEGAIAMVQGSATLNIPALAMVFFVFTPLLGLSRLVLALVGALILGPIVVFAVRKSRRDEDAGPGSLPIQQHQETSPWGPALTEAFRDWARTSIGYLVRMGPIMIAAGFASGLAIQWISPETVSRYLGNDLMGVAIAATLGIAINVPLLFEIPLVALLLLLGMGTAPAATLLFAAAAGGPVTFWGLARIMPRRATVVFAGATWALAAIGGMAVLGIGALIWEEADVVGLRGAEAAQTSDASTSEAPPPSRESSTADETPSFIDVSLAAGIDFVHRRVNGGVVAGSPGSEVDDKGSYLDVNTGAGALVLDFNNDGFQDIYVTNSEGPNALYRNEGDGTFTDVAVAVGVDDPQGVGNGGCAADYDNDGDQDLFVTSFGSSKLFRNNGNGQFTDVTGVAAVDNQDVTHRSTGCAWGDYDRDGSLDLIVVRHLATWAPEFLNDRVPYAENVRSLALYHNNGDGSFTDVTPLLGDTLALRDGDGKVINNISGAGYQPGWVDFDNDGDLDLYVVNDYGRVVHPNVLWRNDGAAEDGSWEFLDVSESSGADVIIDGMGLAIGDYDLDGFLDFYMSNTNRNALLRNNGDGLTFTNTTVEAGAEIGIKNKQSVDWATMFFDYDNDGLEDLYIVSGFLKGLLHGNPVQQPNILLRNKGDGTFSDVSSGSGVDDEGIGRGGVYLDFNKDGCLDLFVANLGQSAKLFQNACGDNNNWLEIKTVGSLSNRDGIGARITMVAGGTTQIREISGGSSQMGQNMMAAHFGLDASAVADSVTITWPSGKVQTLTDVDANRRLTVIEPE